MNNLQEAYLAIYQEALDPEERALRRAEIADRKAGRMDSKVAKKYSDSESKSAEREDKKSKGKHIHGMADSVELDGDLVDEEIRNPESRKKLRAIMDTDKGRKGDASKGENPRSKYPSEKSKQASHLLHGSGETGSKGNPVRSRGGTSAPPEERVGKGPNRAKNAAYWAGNAGPTRDRGAGNKAKRRSAELGEAVLDEKTLTSAETKKREEIVKSMKKSAGDFEKRYPGRGKEVMYATATKQAKRVAEAVGQMPGRETTPPSGTTAKQDDIQKRQVTNAAEKQKLANLKTMQQKQQMLQRQKLNLQKQGKLPLNAEEVEHIDELNRYEKETGKDYKTGKSVTKGGTMGGNDSNSKVMRHMHKVMGAGRMGAGGPIQPRGKGKVPGQKPPAAGEYGSERRSPEQIVKNRRVAHQQGRDNMSSRFD